MFTDNPSYFSLSSGTVTTSPSTTPTSTTSVAFSPPSKGSTGLTALFRRRPCKMGTTSSSTSGASTPTEEKMPMLSRNGTGHFGNSPHAGSVNQRRSFRNLFRSVSANADNERTQQFLKGDPRPSDVAPPSPYLPRSHSHSENDKRHPGRSRAVLKSASELLSNDMVYCGLARDNHDRHDDDGDDDDRDSNEVFVGVDDARYYNLSSTLPAAGSATAGRRRHSISTFIGKDRGPSSKDISKRQPQSPTVLVEPNTMAPPTPVETVDGVQAEDRKPRSCSRSRRRRHRSSSSRAKDCTARRLTIASMENSQLVAKLLRAKKKRSSTSWNLLADGCAAATEIGACKREPPKRDLLEFRFLCEWTPCSRFFVEKIAGDRGSTLHMYGLFVSRCQVLRGELNLREKKEIGEGEAREESTGSRSATGLSKIDSHPEDDVLFVSSKDSEISGLWVNYLTACFEQISRQQGRPPFKVRHVTIEEPMLPGAEERIRSARLQIVVVCPILLERAQSRPEQATNLSRQLIADKVLAMMLGVHDSHISDVHKSILVSYNQWRKFFVKDQDETFVGELLGAAVGILGTTPPPALRCDKTAFSVHPKKVKLGHNRIIALLNDPLRPEDNVSVIVDRCGEAIDIAHVKRRNPYALQFCIPDRCLEVSMLVGVRISKNGCPLGVRQVKCESRLRELDQILRAHDNPLEFMCQTFGFNPGDREKLDNWMVHAFQRNVPPHFNLLSTPSGVVSTQKVHSSEYSLIRAAFIIDKL
ncbi:hypothetical protein WN51_03803 [Melipona quadrifasciata]|uniref:DBB domain-containing protein n=1 Tax=Melipona quadrifasciata TaxID=166423 RepID=A0A0M8ZWI4_9HYME|nr:hypothetical protein WN51_03803 [Melipona quadrifasciata]